MSNPKANLPQEALNQSETHSPELSSQSSPEVVKEQDSPADSSVKEPFPSPETGKEGDEKISQTEVVSDAVTLSPEKLSEMLHQAYLRGRNENIEAVIESESTVQKKKRSVAGDILVKGLTGVAKAILSPGRRSIWPK